MEEAYARAIWKSVENGKTPHEAVASLVELLKKQGRSEFLPRVFHAVRRLAEREAKTRPRVYVAHEKDARHAFAQSGVAEADVCVDETLIGGWRLEDKETLIDASFKKMLLDMYNRATA